MIATECPPVDVLQAFSTGRLDEFESSELLDHVNDCANCQHQLDSVEDADDSLIASLRRPDEAEEPYEDEPFSRLAIAKALGALVVASEVPTDATSDNAAPATPPSMGEYEIVRPLGSGGMGQVFLARHTKLGRQVAVKVLANHRLNDSRMRERFEAEMRAVGKLSHPNIVTAHDARDVDGTAVLVTEYIDGFDLRELLRRHGPLSVADACEVTRQVAIALQYTSQQGFVHRDIKPSNIMLSLRGEVKVLDLGLARFHDEGDQPAMTAAGQTMGTADYVAPEQVTDSREADVRADIYSLGCTLFQLLTGHPPFATADHATIFAKLTAHVSEPPPSLSERLRDAPAGLVKLLAAMLSKEPSKRPEHPQIVVDRLSELAQGSDLQQLVERASECDPEQDAVKPVAVSKPRTAGGSGGRRVPLLAAVAGGFFSFAIGLCLGIWITITNPDGTQTIMQLTDGSRVEVSQTAPGAMESNGESSDMNHDGGESVAPDSSAESEIAGNQKARSTRIYPMSIGILCTEEDVGAETRKAAIAFLDEVLDGIAIRNEVVDKNTVSRNIPIWSRIGVWLPLDTDIGDSGTITVTRDGQSYGLVRSDRNGLITWDEIAGRIEMQVSGRSGIEFHFNGDLEQRMLELTRENRMKHLAVIVQGRIMAAPMLVSEIGGAAEVNGEFDREDLASLNAAMNGLRVIGPPTESEPSGVVPRPDSSHDLTRERLKRIGLAFHNFHDAYKKLPGSANLREGGRGAEGEHPFSWRVALLPFIEEQELFEQYRFDEPWDSEHNLTLLEKMPEVYRSPLAPDGTPVGETHYQGFVGPQTALGDSDGQDYRSITDGTSNTLLIVESRDSVPWTKPQDLPFESVEDAERVKAFDGQPLSYLTTDGAVHEIAPPVDYELLGKLITRNGGEPIRDF